MIIISIYLSWNFFFISYFNFMDQKTYNCKKCGLTISENCSKCNRVVDVKILDDGCIVKLTKCSDCADIPVIKDVCSIRV